jgi:hypothetical protein
MERIPLVDKPFSSSTLLSEVCPQLDTGSERR